MDWGIFRPSRATTLCLVLLTFSFFLMTFRLTRAVQSFRAFLFYWISPTQETATASIKFASGLGVNLADLIRAHHENRILKEKMNQLSIAEAQYREALNENERLRGLLELKSSLRVQAVSAFVSGRDAQSWNQAVWIDKGLSDGVVPDSPVLSIQAGTAENPALTNGVVGRVLESGSHSSKVLLISDRLSSVAVSLPRTSEQGLVQGQGSFGITVEYMDPGTEIQVGDEVVTSGLGGIFPAGLPVGTIKNVIVSPSGFKRAELKPAVTLNKIREVLVLQKEKSPPPAKAEGTQG